MVAPSNDATVHSCHFLQNLSLIFQAILLQNLKFDTKYEPKSEAVEIFFMKNVKIFDEIFDFMLVTKNCY